MRILIATTEPTIGDRAPRAIAYAMALSGRGHEVLVAHRECDSITRAAALAGIPTREIETRRRAQDQSISALSLHRRLREFRPDVVHVDAIAAALAFTAASPRTPLLMTLEGLYASRVRTAFAVRASRARVHATSHTVARSLISAGISSTIPVIPPGLDLAELSQEAREGPAAMIPDGRPLVVCANPNPIANGAIGVVEAWQKVVALRPDALLLIVGARADRARLRARAGELGIFHEVAFVDDDPSSAPYLAAADIVVVTACRESTTLSALRALALERPVVATAIGGMSEVVRDGDTGWLVPPDSATAMSRGLLAALADSSERERRARQGRSLVERNHGLEQMVDLLEAECRAAVERRPLPRRDALSALAR